MQTADVPLIEMAGSPRERGLSYGKEVKKKIAKAVKAWRQDLGNYTVDGGSVKNRNPDDYLDAFFSDTNYLHSIERWAPDLLEEVKGIAEGSEQNLSDILGLQLIDEEWMFGIRHSFTRPIHKCTGFGVVNQVNGKSYAGQNMDIPRWVEGSQVLLRMMSTDAKPEALIFSFAGSIGLNGINANGLGVTCNTLPSLAYSIDGLPVLFIIRKILEMQDIDQAEDFLRSIKHASGQNYIISSVSDTRCIECSATNVVRLAPVEWGGRVFHTNHVLANRNANQFASRLKAREKNSKARLASISRRLGKLSKVVTLADAKYALAAHDDLENPVCRCINLRSPTDSIGYTAGASIYEFNDRPRLHFAAGPPCETTFVVFEFTKG